MVQLHIYILLKISNFVETTFAYSLIYYVELS